MSVSRLKNVANRPRRQLKPFKYSGSRIRGVPHPYLAETVLYADKFAVQSCFIRLPVQLVNIFRNAVCTVVDKHNDWKQYVY